MIIIKVRNGIGNQLFTYAFGEYLKEKYPRQKIKYDISELPLYVNGRYTISFTDFVSDADLLTPKEVRKYLGKILYFNRLRSNERNLLDTLERKLVNHVKVPRKLKLIKEPIESEEDKLAFVDKIAKLSVEDNINYVFDGYWEDIRYVERVRDKIKENLNFTGVKIREEYKRIIDSKDLVAIHIRRGDYIKESCSENYPRYFYAYCDESYYKTAIKMIEKQVEMPFFVIFSDDIDYVKKKYDSMKNKIIVENQKDYEDLYLMTICKHHIIANSTFSFWGAYVAKQEGITIAPNIHYSYLKNRDNIWSKKFFEVPGWKYIEVKNRI